MLVRVGIDWIDPAEVLCVEIRPAGGPVEGAEVHVHWRVPGVAPLVIGFMGWARAEERSRTIADVVNGMAPAGPQEPPT